VAIRIATLFLLCATVLLIGPAAAARADSTTQLPFTGSPLWLAVDPIGQHVFVSGGPGTSSIVVLDFDGNIVKTITGEGGASQMAVDTATHTLYVALHDATAISEIDTTTLAETNRFSTAPYGSPSSLVIAGGKLWFSCLKGGTGCVASASLGGTGLTDESANLSGIDQSTALAANGNLLALGDSYAEPPTVAVYDVSGATPSLVSSVWDPGGDTGSIDDMTFDPTGANLLLAAGAPYYVASLATSTLQSSAEYSIGAYPDSVAVSADGAYVAAGRATIDNPDIAVYPTGDTTPVRKWSLETNLDLPAHALAFSPDASKLFAVIFDPGSGHMDFHVLEQPTVPQTETSVTLSASQYSFYAGQQVKITAHVTGTSTGTVDLYETPSGGSQTLVDTGTLSGGDVTFTVNPTISTSYSAVLEAGPGYGSSTSGDLNLSLSPPQQTAVLLSPPQQSVLAGDQGTLTAHVNGTPTGTVDLYGTPNGGSKTLVATGSFSSGNDVSFTVEPAATTTYWVVLEQGIGYSTSTSQDATVSVIPRSLPIAASQSAVTYEAKVALTLTGLTSGTVNLFATPNGQPQRLSQTTNLAAGEHSVTFTVSPQRSTSYFAELGDQSAASKNLAISVCPLLALSLHAKWVSARKVHRSGEKIALGAIRNPLLPGEPLEIELDRERPGGSWKTVKRAELPVGGSGAAIAVVTVRVTGRYRARVSYAGDGDYASVSSAWRGFRVG
jgi:hypothetical protein